MQSVCSLALEQVNVYLAGTRGYALERLSGQNGLAALAMGGVGIGLVVAAPLIFPRFFADSSFGLLLLAGLATPFILHTNSSNGLLTIQGQVTWPFLSRVVGGVFQTALVTVLYVSHRLTPALVLAVVLVAAIINWIMVADRLEGPALFRVGWDNRLLRDTLRHALLIHSGMVLWFLHLRADMFMTKGMLGIAALGQYSLAVTLAETTLLLTDSLSRAILPRQMSNTAEQAGRLSLRAARTNFLVGLIAMLGWVVCGPWLIPLCFGSAFRAAYWPLIALMPGIAFVGMQQVCGGAVLRDASAWKFPAIYSVSLVLNIVLNFFLLPVLGTAGASIASSLSYGVGLMMFLRWTARLAKESWWEGLIPRKADLTQLYGAAIHSFESLAANIRAQEN